MVLRTFNPYHELNYAHILLCSFTTISTNIMMLRTFKFEPELCAVN